MSFQKISLKPEYRTRLDNIIEEFFTPALSQSILYQRATGFFSSSALLSLKTGIKNLLANGGAIQLITSPRLSEEDWQRMMNHIRGIADAAKKWNVRAVVHPHAGGYIEFADEIDKVMEDLPAEVVGLCLDTGHLRYSQMDPVEWLRKYADRLDYIHFKDINEKVYNEVLNEHIRFFEGCGKGAMCPIGTGMLDYPAIYKLLTEEINYNGYITIEQERDPRNVATSLRDVKASVDYLKSLGFE